jgi:uncharacterized protein (DUF433 family)
VAQRLRPVKPPIDGEARADAAPTCYNSAAMSDDHLYMPGRPNIGDIDWSQCRDAESVPDRCSGAWVVKGTRIPVQAILDNAEDCTPEEIAGPDIYPDLALDLVRRILDFALAHPPPLMFGEGEPTALLLAMVLHHCGTAGPAELDSYGVKVNVDAMRMLHQDGYIEIIDDECGDRIAAKLTFPGRLLIPSLRAEQAAKLS